MWAPPCPKPCSPTPGWRASTSPAPPPRFNKYGSRSATASAAITPYPRLVGETGGKDFILAHPSADPDILTTALIRGAFDYQGQKCSAASRAFIPSSTWARMGEDLIEKTAALTYGDVTDFTNFGGAVIDKRSFDRNAAAIARAKSTRIV